MTGTPLHVALESLRERAAEQIRADPLMAGVAAFLGRGDPPSPTGAPKLWTYQDVALHAVSADDASAGMRAFSEGATWLKGCHFFRSGVPAGFEGDPLAMFAVAIGFTRQSGLDHDWLVDLVRRAERAERDPWRLALLRGALALQGQEVSWDGCAPVVAVVLEARGVGEAPQAAREQAFQNAMAMSGHGEQAVFQLVAIEYLLSLAGNIDVHRPSVQDVCDILRRVPAALKRWPWEDQPKSRKKGVTAQKWDLQFEDHFQALLYAILRPVFTDIDDEEFLKSIGHKTPRADFVIPSLHLVIEVKFQREATQSARAKIIEEVAADCSLYLNDGTPYDAMVAIVWDDTSSVQHHAELVAGLRALPGVVGAIVVPRPGSWKRYI